MSLLGEKIKVITSETMATHAPKLVDHFMQMVRDCSELDENIQEFSAYVCAEDGEGIWESLCIVMDTLTKKQLAEEVGIVIKMENSNTAKIKWSGI